ncbi:MAG TPA: Ig-like domain-containing protein [Gemmatimonadaceae bacterium]
MVVPPGIARGQGPVVVRRLIVVLAVAGCAQAGVPPGGPPDKVPPKLVRITPDTNALNVRGDAITFEFDEVVSERPRSAPSLAELFIVSPSRGPSGVSWRRRTVQITPRGGLRPNTTYTVRMLPGMVDLDGNADSSGVTIVFSTGPALANGKIAGRVFDWVADRPAPRARVEAITLPDSLRYGTEADSSGAFVITNLPPGPYLLRALIDVNRNGVVDGRELFDTLTVTLADSLRQEMLAAVRDSLGVGLATADLRDSLTLRLTLDRPLDTLFVPARRYFSIKAADSSVVEYDTIFTQADVDRRTADSTRNKAIQDSVRRAFVQDSTRRADSVRTAGAPPPATPPSRPTGRRPGATNAPPPAPPRDTSNRIIRHPSARIPTTVLYVKFRQALRPATSYRITADSLRSVTGAVRTSSRVFTTPRPAARPDTGRARPDTGRTRD